jgi:hypothetical protein
VSGPLCSNAEDLPPGRFDEHGPNAPHGIHAALCTACSTEAGHVGEVSGYVPDCVSMV